MTTVAVCAGKGSPGATFVSLNLARALKPSLLLDLDPHGGDLAAYLGLDPRKGIYPLRLLSGGYAPEGLSGEVEERMGVSAINGFPRPGDAEPETVEEILSAAGSLGRSVVADLGRVLQGFTHTATQTERVIVVTRPDIVSVHGAERAIDALTSSGVPESSIGVVVNAWSWKQAADLAEIEGALRCPVLGMIPRNDRAASRALRDQGPVTARKVAKSFDNLALKLKERVPTTAERVGAP